MPEFGFPQFTVVASLSYFSRKEDFHPQSPVAVPQPSSADTKGILMMFLHCPRLPTISKSSFANKGLNSLLELVILTLSKYLLCPNTTPAHPSSCTDKFPEVFWDRCKTKERAESVSLQSCTQGRGHRVHSTWESFGAQLKATPCPACQGLETTPKRIKFMENL